MTWNVSLPRPLGAVLVVAGLLLLAATGFATAWADLSAASDERDAKAAFVARSLGASKAGASANGPGVDHGLAVAAESDTRAAAEMDAVLRAAVAAAGGTLVSSQAEAKHDETERVGGTERIEVDAVFQGSVDTVQAALYRLETGRPMVLVDSLSAHPLEAGGGVQAVPVLEATVVFSAYWQPPKP